MAIGDKRWRTFEAQVEEECVECFECGGTGREMGWKHTYRYAQASHHTCAMVRIPTGVTGNVCTVCGGTGVQWEDC